MALTKRHDAVEVDEHLSMFTILFLQLHKKDSIPYRYIKLLHVSAYNGLLQDGG